MRNFQKPIEPFVAAWQSRSIWIAYFLTIFKASSEANLSRSNLGSGRESHICLISYLRMKLLGCASHFPLVEKCLCFSIFAFLYTNLRNSLGYTLKSYAMSFSSPCFLEKKVRAIA